MLEQIVIKLDVPSQAVSTLSGNRRGSTRSYRQTAAVSRLREQAYYLARSLKNSGATIGYPTHLVGPDVRIDPSVRAAPGVVHVELKFTPLTPRCPLKPLDKK